MCSASLTIFENLAISTIGLGTILLLIEGFALLFARHEQRNAFLRAKNF